MGQAANELGFEEPNELGFEEPETKEKCFNQVVTVKKGLGTAKDGAPLEFNIGYRILLFCPAEEKNAEEHSNGYRILLFRV